MLESPYKTVELPRIYTETRTLSVGPAKEVNRPVFSPVCSSSRGGGLVQIYWHGEGVTTNAASGRARVSNRVSVLFWIAERAK